MELFTQVASPSGVTFLGKALIGLRNMSWNNRMVGGIDGNAFGLSRGKTTRQVF